MAFPTGFKKFHRLLYFYPRIIAFYYMHFSSGKIQRFQSLNGWKFDLKLVLDWFSSVSRVIFDFLPEFFFLTFTSYFWEAKFQFQKHLALSSKLPISSFDLICKIECLF